MFKRFTIKQLLLLAFLLAGLLPAMLVSFFSFYQARASLKKEISHDMQTLSIAVVNQIDALIAERVKDATSWSKLAIMQELQIGDVDKRLSIFLSELKSSYGDAFLAIHALNLQGNIVASSEPNRLNKAYKQQLWFSKNTHNEMIDFATINKQAFAFIIPIYAQNEQKIGSLVAEFNWQKIQDLIDATLQNPISAAVFNGDQILSASSHWRGQNEHVLHVMQAFPKQSITPNWQLRLEKSHSVAVAPVHRLGYVFLGLLITTLLLATLLVTPIARAITQPLAKLTEFVKNVAPANTSQSIHLDSAPLEAQALSNAFNQLLADLAKSQANLTRAAKLAVVGEMAAAMSHEVRTPLGILRSSADLLLREPKLSKEGKEVLGFVISETERLNKLVSDLIDAARPKLPNFKSVDITHIIQHCIALLQASAKAKSIMVNFDAAAFLMLDADSDQMTQVMMNLLQNAIQILPNNGLVNIHAQQISDDILITVEDNGAGIAAENQAQIFEPFFTQRAGGVGLGLAVVRQIVEAHRGKIVYETSPLGGAQFSITLPKTTY
jgi:two-component system, NtrC family, sensor histidine kinase HydH